MICNHNANGCPGHNCHCQDSDSCGTSCIKEVLCIMLVSWTIRTLIVISCYSVAIITNHFYSNLTKLGYGLQSTLDSLKKKKIEYYFIF